MNAPLTMDAQANANANACMTKCRMRWPSMAFMRDIVDPLLNLHTTSGLLRLYPRRLEIQVVSRQQNAMVERRLEHGFDLRFDAEWCKQTDSMDKDQCCQSAILNLTAWQQSMSNEPCPLLKAMPGILPGICPDADFSTDVSSLETLCHPLPPLPSTLEKQTRAPAKGKGKLSEAKTQQPSRESEWIWFWSTTPQDIGQLPRLPQDIGHLVQRLTPTKPWIKFRLRPNLGTQYCYYQSESKSALARPKACLSTSHVTLTQMELIEMSIFHQEATLRLVPHPDQKEHKGMGSWEWKSPGYLAQYKIVSPKALGGAAAALAGANANALQQNRITMLETPEWMQQELWERHEYSIQDIRKTLDAFPDRLIWQLLTQFALSATNAATIVHSDFDTAFTCGTKSTAIAKLMQALQDRHAAWDLRPSVTWDMSKPKDPNGDGKQYDVSKRHHPCLPVHRLARADYDKIKVALATDIMVWRGIFVCILEENADETLLTMARVIPKTEYISLYGAWKEPPHQPRTVQRQGQVYVCLDETFFFFSPATWMKNPLLMGQDFKRQRL